MFKVYFGGFIDKTKFINTPKKAEEEKNIQKINKKTEHNTKQIHNNLCHLTQLVETYEQCYAVLISSWSCVNDYKV